MERDSFLRLHTASDVLSLCLQDEVRSRDPASSFAHPSDTKTAQNIAYMGMRNGIIDRWDWREASGKTDTIVNMSDAHDGDRGLIAGKGAASVDHLRIVHGHELLVRTMRGDVRIH